MGLAMDASMFAKARSFSPNHNAANNVEHDKIATCARPHTPAKRCQIITAEDAIFAFTYGAIYDIIKLNEIKINSAVSEEFNFSYKTVSLERQQEREKKDESQH